MCLATAATLAASGVLTGRARAQQSPQPANDQTVFLGSGDALNTSSLVLGTNFLASTSTYSTAPLTNPTVLPAGSPPQAGYAYVVTGNATSTGSNLSNGTLRTPQNGSTGIPFFAGDSLAILPFNGQANLYSTATNTSSPSVVNPLDTTASLSIFSNTSGQAITVPNLILGNGGAVINYSGKATTLNGTINLLPAGTTIDGITTTVSGGILDPRAGGAVSGGGLTVGATLVGAGQLHVLSTNGSVQEAVTLANANTNFTGGILLDNTVGSSNTSGSSSSPFLYVNNASALGTGTLTILSINPNTKAQVGAGPTLDNTTGFAETLTTNNNVVLNGSVQFAGTNSLGFGTGTVTLAANSTVNLSNSVLSVNGVNGPYTLTIGSPNSSVGGALEVPTLGSITSGVSLATGGTLAFPAATTTPAQYAAYAGASPFSSASNGLLGIDTAGVASGLYNQSAALPSGGYGLAKLGAGTLYLAAPAAYTGETAVLNGTLQLGAANALANTAYLVVGTNTGTSNATVDLNGFNQTISTPSGGAGGGLITNASATAAVLTITGQPANGTTFNPNGSYFGAITGNLSVVIAYPTPTSNSSPVETFGAGNNGFETYTGSTTLQSGALSIYSINSLPPAPSQVIFAGGLLKLASGIDPSALFAQTANQPFTFDISGTTTFASSLNSSGGSLTLGLPQTTTNNFGQGGTLVLTAANNYSGPTVVNLGLLQIANPKALAGTSGVTVNYPPLSLITPLTTAVIGGTLQINDGSGTVGLAGGVAGGVPIPLTLSGVGSTYSYISRRVGVTNRIYGVAYYGALQGVAGSTDVWAGNIVIGTPGAGISGGFNNASSGGTLAVTGVISGTGPLQVGLNGNSTTVLAGPNTYSGETQINCSTGLATTLQLGGNGGVPAVSGLNFDFNPANTSISGFAFGTETLDLNGYSTAAAYLTNVNTFNGANYTIPAAIVNTRGGTTSTLTVTSGVAAAGSTAQSNLTYNGSISEPSGAGKVALVFSDAGGVQTITGPNNNYSGCTTVNAGTVLFSSLTAAGTGTITVNGGATFLQNTPSGTVFSLLRAGYAGGTWNGATGINSTVAATNLARTAAVGMYQSSSQTTFDGQTLNPTDVVLAYTYYGDANLDGKVDGQDYAAIDAGFLSQQAATPLTGWQNGDFNYDGKVDASDYTLIDNAFNLQAGQLGQSTSIAAPSIAAAATDEIAPAAGTTAVPEPASVGVAAVAAAALVGRRRRS